jgi:actin-related protein
VQALETFRYIIVDFGSQHIKIGFSGEGYPRFILPSVVAYKNPDKPFEEPLTAYNALYSKGLTLIYPFQEKTISDHAEWQWKPAKELITRVIRDLKIKSEDYLVFYIEPAHSSPNNTQRLIDLLEKKFRFQKVLIYKQSYLIFKEMLREQNKSSGLVIELGHSISSITAFFKNWEIETSQKFFLIGGRNILEEFLEKIKKRSESEFSDLSTYDLTLLVNKYFYVPVDYEEEQENYDRGYIKDIEENLPLKRKTVTIGDERFRFSEGLFRPELIKQDIEWGLAKVIIDSINECPIDTRSEILENVIISGGLSKLKGLDKRIIKELKKAYPNLEVNVNSHQRREVTSWIAADNLIKDGLHDIQDVQERHLTVKVPETILQYFYESVNSEKAQLWVGASLLIEKTMHAVYEDINNRLFNTANLKLEPANFFSIMSEQGIINKETYNWGKKLNLFKVENATSIKMENRTKSEIGEKLDFLLVLLNEIYNPKN